MAGEGGHQHPPPGAPQDRLQGLSDPALRGGEAFPLRVGRIAQQRQDSLVAELSKPGEVEQRPIHGGLIDLEIRRVDHQTHGGANGQAQGGRNAVRHLNKLHLKRPNLQHVAGLHLAQVGARVELMLRQLGLHQSQGEVGAHQRGAQCFVQVGHRADVVLVSVRQDDPLDLLGALEKVLDIGNDEIHPQKFLLGKHESGIHHEDLSSIAEEGAVEAELAAAPQEGDLQGMETRSKVGRLF